jgi:23S rRNA (uracil1939-C5)-methyltransferase
MVIFVDLAAPGDIVDLQVTRKRKRYAEARILQFHKFSSGRIPPPCDHFGVCGGCKWQHIPYSEQIKFKQTQVVDALTRIAKVEINEIRPILGSAKEYFYRNKLEYAFSNRRWYSHEELASGDKFDNRNALGFHVPGMFDKIVNIEKCWLQPEPSNLIRNYIREYTDNHGLEYYDPRNRTGFLRNLLVRTCINGEVMVILSFFREDIQAREELLGSITEAFPELTSVMYTINDKANDTLYDLDIQTFKGRDYIIENLEDLSFRIGPKSFFQTNSLQSLELYRMVRELAELRGNELVYDLYTGTGTIALFLARHAGRVIGIESVPEAIADARINAGINGIINADFFSGDIKDLLTSEFLEQKGKPDIIITDPPRTGMHEAVIKTILEAKPLKIIYVSCNPATQARDVERLSGEYVVKTVQAVDMFPQTHHVENIILLTLKENK